jgi:hypothetical protein
MQLDPDGIMMRGKEMQPLSADESACMHFMSCHGEASHACASSRRLPVWEAGMAAEAAAMAAAA